MIETKYPSFTKEQWNEIYAARARLEAYRNKVQLYPKYPEPPKPEPQYKNFT